jgi:gamma-glutamyltranspeptidase / glutathione hydrolase
MRASVAAGHPATAAAGVEILVDGGTAADAAVAAVLASCVAETIMTGLLGGAHAIVWDRSQVRNLDGFAAVPSGRGELIDLEVGFGEETVAYAVGPASCAVPGLPGALDALWREHCRLPWRRLVEPALRLAREGVALLPAHAKCLAMLEPVMTLNRGAELYAPGGTLLSDGDLLAQPGLVAALEVLAEEGPASVYRGSLAEALLDVPGIVIDPTDLEGYEARWHEPIEVPYAGTAFFTRGGLSGVPQLLERMPRLAGVGATERVLALVGALVGDDAPGHTTNIAVVDGDGSAVVVTSSLGLGSGDFVPGFDLHLNSLLGEKDLLIGTPEPGARMESMMAPSIAVDSDGLALAIGSAGGARLRTALTTVAAGVLDEQLEPQAAVDRARIHPAGHVLNAEPGVDERALAQLEGASYTVRRWHELHHYFGGVSLVSRWGAAADPRRSGAAQAA